MAHLSRDPHELAIRDLFVRPPSAELEGDDVSDNGVGVGGGFSGADDESASSDSGGESEGVGGADGLKDLRERIEANVRLSELGTESGDEPSVDNGAGVGGFVEPGAIGLDDVEYDDFQGDVDNGLAGAEGPEVIPSPHDGSGAPPATPRLDMLHTMAPSFAQSTTVEGGEENLRYNTKAGSEFYPFATKEQQGLFAWQHTFKISQKALRGLLDILNMEHEGDKFDVSGLKGVNPEHFYSRMRPYLPLLQLIERDVPSTQDGKASAVVYDIPVNLLLHRSMQLPSETALSETFPGGKILRGEEAAQHSLTSDHVDCVPTRNKGNVLNSNHNGKLARSSPFYGFDGIRGRVCGRKVYVHDCIVCDVGGDATLCRMLELLYDAGPRQAVVTVVRPFRMVAEVDAAGEEEKRGELVRVWEDCTPGNEMELMANDVLGLAEVYTLAEVDAGQHNGDGGEGVHSFPWDRFVGEGFVESAGNERFDVSESPWNPEGTADRPLFSLRCAGVHFNDTNKPFFSAAVQMANDAFNSVGLAVKVGVCFSFYICLILLFLKNN